MLIGILLQVLTLFVQAEHVISGIERNEEHCSSLPFLYRKKIVFLILKGSF